MKYCLNIKEYNISELEYEGKLVSGNNLFEGSSNGKKLDELGFFNFKLENTPGFSIIEANNMFYEDVRISGYNSEPVFSMDFVSQGTVEYETGNNKRVISNGGTNNIWSLNSGYFGYSTYKKDVKTSGFAIYFYDGFMKEITNKYPELLDEIYIKFISGKSFSLNPQYRFTSMEMMQTISQIRNAKLMGKTSQIYTEAKIMELLALQLQQGSESKGGNSNTYCKNAQDIEKIHEAKRLLVADLNQSLTIRQLSRQVGINENKLKYGFKEVYNHTIFGYLFDYKMDLACKLLLDTKKNIVDIADQCGYEYASHFTTAFRRKFSVTPQDFRKRHSLQLV